MVKKLKLLKFRVVVVSILFLFLVNVYSKELSSMSNSTSSHFIEANGIKIHYIEKGKGPLVVLLHGWPETSLEWSKTINVLSTEYRVVAPDLRGLGRSERTLSGYDKKTIATDINSLIAALGEKQAIIIGHDMGGKVAYVMAHLYPQSVTKLVLVDCFIPGTENTDPLQGGAWHYGFHMAPNFPEMLTQGREKQYINAQIKALSFKKDAISEQTINEYAKYYSTPGGMTAGFNYYRALKEDATLVKTFKGNKLLMPVLVITGQHSVGDKLAKTLKDETPSLKIVIIKDSGHFVPEEAPELFNSEVLKFLDKKE